MDCKQTEELLSSYLDNELSLEVRSEVEKHLKTCQKCSVCLFFMREAMKSLAEFPEAKVSENLLFRLYEIPEKKRRFQWSLNFLGRPSLQPLLAAVTVLMTVVSFYFFHPDRNIINKNINRQLHLGYSKIEKIYAKAESIKDSLDGYKDNLLVSLKNINPFRETEN